MYYNPAIERAHELIRQVDENQRRHAEWRASRTGEPDVLEAWEALRNPREPQWIVDREKRRAELEAKQAAERAERAEAVRAQAQARLRARFRLPGSLKRPTQVGWRNSVVTKGL